MSLVLQWPWCAALLPLPYFINKIWRNKPDLEPSPVVYFPHLNKISAVLTANNSVSKTGKVISALWWILWCLLVVTLMRPEAIEKPEITSQYGYDVMLAIDLSNSMSALDFSKNGARITRLHAVKEVVAKFVEQRRGDRVGLIVFAKSAYTYVPLTFDIDSANLQLQNLAVGMAGDSTSIGDAIGVAIKNLQARHGARILILLTDGADNSSSIPPLQAAKLAAKHNIKIYTVGVGSNGLVPMRDPNGNLIMVEAMLDEKLLAEIAELTHGLYARATNKTDLAAIYQQIDKLEKHEGASQVLLLRNSLHYYPLCGAVVVLLALIIICRRDIHAA